LYVDANAIVANPLLRGPSWDAVGEATVQNLMDLYVSDLAVDEAAARFRAASTSRENQLDKTVRQWPSPARASLIDAIRASRSFSETYERDLRARLEQLGATILPYPEVEHSEVCRRALLRIPPVDSNGNGYRDTLHWLTFIALLGHETNDATACLLSGDNGAFGTTAQKKLEAEVEELGVEWTVEFPRTITDFDIPGQFAEEEASLDPQQRITFHQLIESEIEAGGSPYDFTRHLARRSGFQEARITDVLRLDVSLKSVQTERRTGDLWAAFSAEAVCHGTLETLEVLDEDAGDYSVSRDSAVWVLTFDGTAVSSGADFDTISTLRLTSVDGHEDLDSAAPLEH
jgi:hypothetical protein